MAFTPSKVIRYYGTSTTPSRKQDTKNKYVQHGRFRNIGETTPTNYVSLAVFDSFSEDFTKNSITEISISFTAAGGYHTNHARATKTLEFYFGYTEAKARDLYGKTSSQKGVIEHTFKQNPDGATFNITITDSTILSLFETAFSQKETKTIAFYSATDYKSGDMSSTNSTKKGWSYNYVQISNLTLEVQTQPRGATIQSLSSSVELGKDCSITIEPLTNEAGKTYTYKAYCQLGSKTTDLKGPTGNTFTIEIPTNWGSEIPSAMTGVGTAIVKTYLNQTFIGTTSKNFNITIPSYSSFGDLTCNFSTYYNTNGTQVFLGGYSKADLSGTLSEQYGATLDEITLSYGSTTKKYSKQISDSLLMSDQSILYVNVVDSRGVKKEYSFNPDPENRITFIEKAALPTLTNFSVARCGTDGNFSSSGKCIGITGTLNNGNSLHMLYGKNYGSKLILEQKKSNFWFNAAENFVADSEYKIVIQAVSNIYFHDSSKKNPIFTGYYATLPSSSFLLHFSNDGNSIGIGGAAEPPESGQNGKITMSWPVKFKGGFYLPKTNEANADYQWVKSISDLGGSNSLPDNTTNLTVTNLTVTNPIKYQSYTDISFYPIKIVTSLPSPGIANVIYFVKSST